MDEWLRLGFSAELRLTVTALRKRKTELSNFDAYYTISAPPHTAAPPPPPPVQRLVGGGLEKCQHQLNVTHFTGGMVGSYHNLGARNHVGQEADKKSRDLHGELTLRWWRRVAVAVTLLSALIHDALRRLNIRFQFTSKLKAMTPDRR